MTENEEKLIGYIKDLIIFLGEFSNFLVARAKMTNLFAQSLEKYAMRDKEDEILDFLAITYGVTINMQDDEESKGEDATK